MSVKPQAVTPSAAFGVARSFTGRVHRVVPRVEGEPEIDDPEDEHEEQGSDDREFDQWQRQHAEELSRDPVLRAEFDEYRRYVNLGLRFFSNSVGYQ